MRRDCAQTAFDRPLPEHPDSGEERDYPYVANFSKGLPHNDLGEVDPHSYDHLLQALASDARADFEMIPLGGDRPLRNPQSGLAYDLEGPDSHHLGIRPAPRIDGPENSSEMGELYWMALARDVNFTHYDSDPLIAKTAADMSRFSDFRGPKQDGQVTPATLFRGLTPGDVTGPFISQFLLKDIPYGSLTINQRQKTVMPGIDYMTDYNSWLAVKRGLNPIASEVFDSTPRYIRNGRDLTAYVHVDALYEAYLNACLILLGMGTPVDEGNPYRSLTKTDAFGTFGDPHILSLVTEVATRALKAVWYQKWYVHRRNRPEEFGGRVHNHLTRAATYPINSEILDSQAVQEVHSKYGTYLLPQAYPEGSPLHPSYGAGHATVAGACVTILKAWFDESWIIPDPVVPNDDGTMLVPYTGPDAGSLTVGGELNKVVANIANGRNFAGIHWRTDYSESVHLGEAIAIGILEEQKITYNERHSFTLTRFDGTTITI
ncbi:MAG: vanadium-dependent haloperoxidase [Acidobacteria bacterium]|nr:vanadium-dependent haloperoxidase [Acidobacteriota bacterium]